MKKSKIMYIEPKDDGKPSASLGQVLAEAEEAVNDRLWWMLNSRPAKGRRKVRITVMVEAV
jgi:hypothetical protein